MTNYSYKNISKDVKDKFIKMLLMLFPNFRSARFKDNGTIIFIQRAWFKRRIKRSFTELLILEIPRELSLVRWGNNTLVDEIHTTIKEISMSTDDKDTKITKVIEYLHSIFVTSKIKAINKDGNITYIAPCDPNIDHIELMETNDFVSLLDEQKIKLLDVFNDLKLIAATWLLAISLWLPPKLILLHHVGNMLVEIREFEYPWRIINTS